MALPQDFWQNEHMFHRFRSKPCQRLLRSGICEWHSQCQFSHDPEWPRRPPSKHNYSPALCPHIRPVMMNNSGEVQLENTCLAGLSCRFSHTKDEVLYHPNIFKMSLCEEHRSLTSDQRNARRSKHRPRCHRYYCPFAHGKHELRTSPMTPEQRETAVRAIGIFPPAMCCGICTNNQLGPVCMDGSSGMGYANSMPMVPVGLEESQLWPGTTQPSAMSSMLGHMVLPGASGGTTTSGIEGRVWGASPWLQQPLQQQQQQQQQQQPQQAGGLNSTTRAMESLNVPKDALQHQMLNTQVEQTQKEAEADDGELDVESEIYGRAIRFLDELSTEESGSEPETCTMKEASIHPSQPIKESMPGLSYGTLPLGWNPQDACFADINGQDRWQIDGGLNSWAMPSIDRIA